MQKLNVPKTGFHRHAINKKQVFKTKVICFNKYGTIFSMNRRPPVYTRAILDFNFSAAPTGSEPCNVQLMIENTGSVGSEW